MTQKETKKSEQSSSNDKIDNMEASWKDNNNNQASSVKNDDDDERNYSQINQNNDNIWDIYDIRMNVYPAEHRL